MFLKYVSSGVGNDENESLEHQVRKLESTQADLESAGSYKEALEISKKIKNLQKNSDLIRIVEDRFDTQISLKPKFIGTLIEFMKQSDVFNKYLDIAHYHILEVVDNRRNLFKLLS